MPKNPRLIVASASVGSASSWSWELKVDDCGLFRWYLDGTIDTHLRGCTRPQAETALRRFVERSLQGELKISEPAERMGADAEQLQAFRAKGTA